MTHPRIRLVGAVLLAVLLAGCSPDDPTNPTIEITQPTGEAALARYVAIGNSLTAGFMDAGLSIAGQTDSYPAQLAIQLGRSGDPAAESWFSQPLIALPGFGSSTPSADDLVAGVLHWDGTGISVLDETPLADVPGELLLASTVPTPYDNLGVPGATTLDVTEALTFETSQAGNNQFFDVILRNPDFGDVSMLGQAIAQGPTLVTLWIGNNDILGGATSGDPVVGENITPASLFSGLLGGIIATLQTGVEARFGYTPEVVVGNIPPILSAPYFVPKAQFDLVTTGGAVPYPTDEDDVAYVRFPGLLLADAELTPLPGSYTLTAAEAAVIDDAVAAYNDAIDAVAAENGAAVADIHAMLLGQPAAATAHFQFLLMGDPPLTVEQAAATTAFSLDGLHPNNRGYTLIANTFIEAINVHLGLEGDAVIAPATERPWDPTYAAYAGKSNQGLVVGR